MIELFVPGKMSLTNSGTSADAVASRCGCKGAAKAISAWSAVGTGVNGSVPFETELHPRPISRS